jgi:Holliday junction DNA helicase RuvA
MIGYLRGQIISRNTNSVLLDVQGVGYEILVPSRLAGTVDLGETLSLYTHLGVREDALTLYGLSSLDDKQLFESLIGISGIGPKIALAILSTYSVADVQAALVQGNAAAFTAVSGIGKKNAERIVLELKNKVHAAVLDGPTGGGSPLHQALTSLGYSVPEIMAMTNGIASELPLDEQIKLALKQR